MPFTLDTHAAVRDLVAAGFPVEQAEAIVEAVAKSDSAIASKTDLDAGITRVEGKVDNAVAGLETKLDNAVARLDARTDGLETKLDNAVAGLETKLDNAVARLDARIDGLETKLDDAVANIDRKFAATASKEDLSRMENHMLKWAVGLGFGFVGLLFALIRFA